jgi:hypothetical protein
MCTAAAALVRCRQLARLAVVMSLILHCAVLCCRVRACPSPHTSRSVHYFTRDIADCRGRLCVGWYGDACIMHLATCWL